MGKSTIKQILADMLTAVEANDVALFKTLLESMLETSGHTETCTFLASKGRHDTYVLNEIITHARIEIFQTLRDKQCLMGIERHNIPSHLRGPKDNIVAFLIRHADFFTGREGSDLGANWYINKVKTYVPYEDAQSLFKDCDWFRHHAGMVFTVFKNSISTVDEFTEFVACFGMTLNQAMIKFSKESSTEKSMVELFHQDGAADLLATVAANTFSSLPMLKKSAFKDPEMKEVALSANFPLPLLINIASRMASDSPVAAKNLICHSFIYNDHENVIRECSGCGFLEIFPHLIVQGLIASYFDNKNNTFNAGLEDGIKFAYSFIPDNEKRIVSDFLCLQSACYDDILSSTLSSPEFDISHWTFNSWNKLLSMVFKRSWNYEDSSDIARRLIKLMSHESQLRNTGIFPEIPDPSDIKQWERFANHRTIIGQSKKHSPMTCILMLVARFGLKETCLITRKVPLAKALLSFNNVVDVLGNMKRDNQSRIREQITKELIK